MIPQVLSIVCWVVTAVLCQGFPGPQVVAGDTYKALRYSDDVEEDTIYTVRDFGAMRPKLVYNCAHIPALCNTVKQYLGPDVTTKTLHYDKGYWNGKINYRKEERRDQSCYEGWTDNNRCPEADQPLWKSFPNPTPREVIMYRPKTRDLEGKAVPGDAHNTQMAYISERADRDGYHRYVKTGAKMTCDEWPAASWIEGGGGTKPAATYCAPQGGSCNLNLKSQTTEQNWQSSGHKALSTYMTSRSPLEHRVLNDVEYTIFKFDFEMVDDAGEDYAIWLEARGLKRYCYGHTVQGGKALRPNCLSVREDDPPIV